MFPILNPPPPALPIPSLWVIPVDQPRASCIMHWTWTGDLFHIWYCTFQCHSPKSSHPVPLPQSPKDCSIHLCLFCCLAYRVIITIFLNFIYDLTHVSMPFSQLIPPCPSPTESKRLFYTSVFLLLSCIQGYRYHLSKFHIYALVYCIGVFLSGLLHSVQSDPVSSTSLELIQMYSF